MECGIYWNGGDRSYEVLHKGSTYNSSCKDCQNLHKRISADGKSVSDE